jgi:ribonucleoside-diphosphate reductase alpha chain
MDIHFDCNLETQEEIDNALLYLYQEGEWYSLYSHLFFGTELSSKADIFPNLKKSKKGKFKVNFKETFSCILGGINFGVVKPKDFKRVMDLMVRFLDSLITYQDYAGVESFERSTKNRRALGISPGNLFYMLAKHNADYNSLKAKELVSEYMENMLFYGLKASMELAKEKGKCNWFNDTKYSSGITPLDTYNKNVDYLVPDHRYIPEEQWTELKEQIQEYGLRNSTLLTAVPASNSSRVSNSISGINPPQEMVYTIEDKKVNIKAVVPNVKRFKSFYKRNSGWNICTKEYTKLVAVIQKYIDQGISLNTYYDLSKPEYEEGIPFNEVQELDQIARKYGIKSLYYNKTKTVSNEDSNQVEIEDEGCASGGCTL